MVFASGPIPGDRRPSWADRTAWTRRTKGPEGRSAAEDPSPALFCSEAAARSRAPSFLGGAAGKKAVGDGSGRAGPSIGFKPSSWVRKRREVAKGPQPWPPSWAASPKVEAGAYKGPRHTHGARSRSRTPVRAKPSPACPGCRVVVCRVDAGAGWDDIGQVCGETSIGLPLVHPDLGPRACKVHPPRRRPGRRQRLRHDLEARRLKPPRLRATRRGGLLARPPPALAKQNRPRAARGRTRRGGPCGPPKVHKSHSAARMAGFGSQVRATSGIWPTGVGGRMRRSSGATALLRWADGQGRRV